MDTNIDAPFASWKTLDSHRKVQAINLDITSKGWLRGCINLVDVGRVVGWAQDDDDPNTPVHLKILIAGVVVSHTVANLYREELRRAGFGNGHHGFDAVLPNRLGGTGLLEVCREADGVLLDSWPTGQLGRILQREI